ncbi:MAG: hypothetical protein RL171_780, partial [Pseudomonadota bacterium]
ILTLAAAKLCNYSGGERHVNLAVAVEFMLIALVVGIVIVYFTIGQTRYLQKFFTTYFPSVISISTTVRAQFFYLSLIDFKANCLASFGIAAKACTAA